MQKGDNNKQRSQNVVKVFVRVRPLISIEVDTLSIVDVGEDERSVTIYVDEYNKIQTKFDKAISPLKNQKHMFTNVSPYIDKLLQGFNLTIFVYGQTGSGKTFTMFGKDWQNNFSQAQKQKGKKMGKQNTPLTDVRQDEEYAGLIPRSAYHLFQVLSKYPNQYMVFCSFIQIYNEKVYDLLQDSPLPRPLNIHESKAEGIFVEGLGEFEVDQYTDCLELMKRGQKNRFIRQTSMNAKSSRSHTIFQIMVQSTKANHKGVYIKSKFNLCDLAGSQKINKKQAMGEDHLNELKNINLSLTTLGKVINFLTSGHAMKNTSIFRQSKLTRLLQQSLIGNTNTIIIGAISPSAKNREQTLSTLKFVERAKNIKLIVKPNQLSNDSQSMVKKLQAELQQLRRILRQKQSALGSKDVQDKLSKLETENKKLKSQFDSKNHDVYALVEQNRAMKKALIELQKTNESLTNRSFQNKSKSQSANRQTLDYQSPAVEKRLNSRMSLGSEHSVQTNKTKTDIKLPILKNKQERSIDKSILYDPKISVDSIDSKQRHKIIRKLQYLQNKKYMKQVQLLNSLQPLSLGDSRRNNKKNYNYGNEINFQSLNQQSYGKQLRNQSKKKQNFSEKIKELENRLKKSNR